MKILLTLIVLAALAPASFPQSVSLRTKPVIFASSPLPSGVHIECAVHYEKSRCLQDVHTLVTELQQYPADELGAWTFVLVPEDEWREVVLGLRHDPSSPAFSVLDARVTVFDSSLFAPSPNRLEQLLKQFAMSGKPLLDLAITHEMGHAICMERDEHRADENGRKIRQGEALACRLPDNSPGRGR